MDRIAMAKML